MKHFYAAGAVRIFHGDCRDVQATFDADSLDACVTDPPYELGFMGKPWDQRGVAFDPETWRAVLRVLKPGAHLVAAGGTRTHHRLMCAIEDAGFEIRDTLCWLYGSGFPKSLDVSKAIDKAAGAEREVVGINEDYLRRKPHGMKTPGATAYGYSETQQETDARITAPATAAARQWEGWGTALKPAWEPWVLARKPLRGTVASNVQRYGTGALNIDGCRIGTTKEVPASVSRKSSANCYGRFAEYGETQGVGGHDPNLGRWPANLVLSHTPDCREVGTRKVRSGNSKTPSDMQGVTWQMRQREVGPHYAGPDGTETVAAWECSPDCPVRMLDEQSGQLTTNPGTMRNDSPTGSFGVTRRTGSRLSNGDTGGASRFFYTAKASRRERECGLPPGLKADHPTVKPVALMRWLVRLVTPPGGTVLDPFMGSGSTKLACEAERFGFVGIEQDEHYCEIAKARKLLPGVVSEAAQLGL